LGEIAPELSGGNRQAVHRDQDDQDGNYCGDWEQANSQIFS